MKVKWGLIGCGDISRKRVAPALRELDHCELVSVNRADSSRLESFAREFGAPKWFETWQDLVVDDEIDAVYVATPVYLHAEQTIRAAEAGKHVLCEKPMAMDRSECQRMIDAAKANNVRLGVAYYRHFYPVVERIKKLIQNGRIGLPVYAQVRNHERFNRRPGEPRYWLLVKSLSGGGPMMDMGCHRIEVLQNIFGPIADVKATLSNVVFEREVEDTATAVLRFETGFSATITSTHATEESQDSLDIFGCRGSIHVPSLNAGVMTIVTEKGVREEKHPPHANVHLPLIEDFANAILEDREPVVTGEIGLAVNAVLDRIYGR